MRNLPEVKLRADNLVVIAGQAGKTVELLLRDVPIGQYKKPLLWEFRDPSMKAIASGIIPHGRAAACR